MRLAEGAVINIVRVEQVSAYELKLSFSDGVERVIDFEPFLRSSRNPLIRGNGGRSRGNGTFVNERNNSAAVPAEREMILFGRQLVTASIRFAKLYQYPRQFQFWGFLLEDHTTYGMSAELGHTICCTRWG